MTCLEDLIVARSLMDWRLLTHRFSRHLFTYKRQRYSKNLGWRPL